MKRLWQTTLAALSALMLSAATADFLAPAHQALIQNPAVSCQDDKKKILCLPLDYSKFDLPFRNEHNVIDIGEYETKYPVNPFLEEG